MDKVAEAKALMICVSCGTPIIGFEDPGAYWPIWDETGECQDCIDLREELEELIANG